MPGLLARHVQELQTLIAAQTKNALEITLFAILTVSTIGQAVGFIDLPTSLQHTAVPWGRIAAITLCTGSLVALIGLLLPRVDAGLLIEQLGLVLVAMGCVGYAIALWANLGGISAAFAIGMSIGIGVGCIVRWFQVQHYVEQRKSTYEKLRLIEEDALRVQRLLPDQATEVANDDQN